MTQQATLTDLGIEQADSTWATVVITLGSFIFLVVGTLVGILVGYPVSCSIAGLILWAFVYVALGWTEVPGKEAWVVERFGKFHKTLKPGISILCLLGIIDKVIGKVQMRQQKTGMSRKGMNFTNGSTVVKMETWYTPIDPLLFVYGAINSQKWMEERINDFVRPRMQRMSIDEAQLERENIAELYRSPDEKYTVSIHGRNHTVNLKEEMALTVGIEMSNLLILNIDLPSKIRTARQRRIDGQTKAEERERIAQGYFDAIQGMVNASNGTLTFKQAKEIFDRNQTLETVRKSGANITFVDRNVSGVVGTFDIGNKGGNS